MIYKIDTDIERYTEGVMKELIETYPAAQQEYILAMRHEQGRRERTATYQLLVETLRQEHLFAEMPLIGHEEQGRPFLINYPQLHNSQSHCRRGVAIVLSQESAVGIDIECRRKISQALVERVCSLQEQKEVVNSDDPEDTFLRFWTRKESYVKYLGTGIRESLKDIERESESAGACIESHPIAEIGGWASICFQSPR